MSVTPHGQNCAAISVPADALGAIPDKASESSRQNTSNTLTSARGKLAQGRARAGQKSHRSLRRGPVANEKAVSA